MLAWPASPPVVPVFWTWSWGLWRKLTSSRYIWEIDARKTPKSAHAYYIPHTVRELRTDLWFSVECLPCAHSHAHVHAHVHAHILMQHKSMPFVKM